MTKEVLQHLDRVIARDKDTWFSIHHRIWDDRKKTWTFPGNAHQDMRTAVRDVMYWSQKGYCVYLANGAFINPGTHYPGKPYPLAIRQYRNLSACKCLYMDIDVKDGAFSSTGEAARAMQAFVRNSGIPSPTVIVESGSGGFHCYWTMSELFTPQEHKKLSGQLVSAAIEHGIHFDRQCTTDACRLLRVAGTWNFKDGDVGKPVTLIFDSVGLGKPPDIEIDDMRRVLAPYKVYVTQQSKQPHRPMSEDDEFADNDDLALPKDYPEITIDKAAEDCPFLDHTLKTGGEGYSEPDWYTTIVLASFTADPTDAAHRLSKGHKNYSVEETDAKLASCQQQRTARSIGPPFCATIYNSGVPQCKACPHVNLGTTPLAVGFRKPNGNTFISAGSGVISASTQITDLPPGYYRGNDLLVYREVQPEKGKEDEGLGEALAFEYQIIPGSGFVEKSHPHRLTFDTVQAGRQVTKTFETGIVSDQYALSKALADEALPVTISPKAVKDLMANYLKILQQTGRTYISAPPFGWSKDHNDDWGFAYAGEFVSPAGTVKCTRPGEGGEIYNVVGEMQHWRALADIVLTPDRPDLCCIAATGFGAPLISMSGQEGLLLGIWSSGSGIGKTTALKLNQAIWSVPNLGGLTDTINYTFAKCAMLRHLPVNYDEIKGAKQIATMADIAMQLTKGGEKGRADRKGEMRIVRDFMTNCNYAANGSVLAAVRELNPGTDASWLRMFEMRGLTPGKLTHGVSDVGRMTTMLKLHHGGVGKVYAAYLGAYRAKIEAIHSSLQTQLDIILKPAQEERFWLSAISTTLLGARIANELGLANFPIAEMWHYMIAEHQALQSELRVNSNDYNKDVTLIAVIGAYLNERRERGMVILDRTWGKQGRPPKNFAKVLNEYPGKQWNRVEVQISGDPLTLRVSDVGFGEWCIRTGRPKTAIMHALQGKLGAKMSGATLGSGSTRAGSSENVWVLNPAGTILEPAVEEYVTQWTLKP